MHASLNKDACVRQRSIIALPWCPVTGSGTNIVPAFTTRKHKGLIYFFPCLYFPHIHTHYYNFTICFAGDFPHPGLELSSSRRVCSFLLICLAVQDQGRFSSSIATIRAPAANLGLLAPLLANLSESGSPA